MARIYARNLTTLDLGGKVDFDPTINVRDRCQAFDAFGFPVPRLLRESDEALEARVERELADFLPRFREWKEYTAKPRTLEELLA